MAPVFDPRDPGFVQDPYPVLAALRATDPVHRSPAGAFVLTRYDDVVAALGDSRLGNAPSRFAVVHERNRARYVCADVANSILPFLDPPRHAQLRRRVARGFHECLRRRPPDVAAMARHLLEERMPRAGMDVVADFATPLAVTVIGDLLGIPAAEHARLVAASDAFFYLFHALPSDDVRCRVDAALADFRHCLAALVAERRRRPGPDVLSALLADDGTGVLDDAHVIDHGMLLFADGVGNVDRAIGNSVHALLRHADQLERLRRQPDLLGPAIEECLRYETPGQFIGRIAREELQVRGTVIRKDASVLLVLGAANRDPAAFAAPDALDIGRSPNPHLAFGLGRHACIGGPLVQLEMSAAIAALLERCPDLALAEETVAWLPRAGHRWIARLRVRWRA